MNVRALLHEVRELTGLRQVQIAKKIGVSQGTVSKWLSEQQSPNKRQWDAFLELIQSDPRTLHLAPDSNVGRSVPVMGRVGAGATIEPDFDQVPPEGLFEVDLPFSVPAEMIGLEVEGESMLPKYDPGDVIVVWKEQRRGTDSFLGQLAAVRTGDGRRFLKTVMRGAERGLYRLESFNARPIEDVEIAWVGEIHVIVPAQQVRHIGAQVRAAAQRRTASRARRTAGMGELPLSKSERPARSAGAIGRSEEVD